MSKRQAALYDTRDDGSDDEFFDRTAQAEGELGPGDLLGAGVNACV